ncbi:Hypothetical protein, putative [Bodo saltans]|uniref:Sfi1 spindle body domain-containing protein n=1 Tax=Bodo saltans TaxID=75058 RepID=A0A0S4KK30_BODSA|nr:Hypothetical protein, putative [Bodo saltans]|eukprot:CUI15558.1 Hypothetical protein, putative [Bodo saltans]
MSVRRKQFSSHQRSDEGRSASTGDVMQHRDPATSATIVMSRSASGPSILPLYRSSSGGSGHQERSAQIARRRRRAPHEFAQLEPQIRALRRQCLTDLIAKRFALWRLFLMMRREAERAKVRELGAHCVRTIMQHSPHCVASYYFRKLLLWRKHQEGRRFQHRSLLSIRRSALKSLVFRHFYSWCRLCTVAQQRRIAATLLRRTLMMRARTAWNLWTTLCATRHRFVGIIQPALAQIHQSSVRVYMSRVLHRWNTVVVRKGLVRHLAAVNATRQLSQWFHLWMRRRYWKQQVQETQRCMRRNLRLLAKGRLQSWIRWTVSKSVSGLIEQKNLALLAAAYLAKWRRLCLCTAQVAHLKARVCAWRMRRHFIMWTAWIRRGIRAVLLEQRHLVCLLQRYYIEWRVNIETRRLSYQSMRSYSHALQRQSFSTRSTSAETQAPHPRLDLWKGETAF